MSWGAKPDGRTNSTEAFGKAWRWACHSVAGKAATIYVPRGSYMLKPIVFGGPCRSNSIVFRIDGRLVAPSNYLVIGNSGSWILFNKVDKLSVLGGTLDARGSSFWSCRLSHGKSCPAGARSISFFRSSNIEVIGLTSMNSQIMNVALNHCKNVALRKIKIRSPSLSPNTDGVHIQSSMGVTISNSVIMTGDDCISLGTGSKNIWIEKIACGPGHGISIGSLGEYANEDGVQNVTVTSSIFKTQNGVRIKSWARPSNAYVSDIVFRNLIMRNVGNPIIINQKYCPSNHGCPKQNSGVKVSKVTYKNIWGTTTTQVAVNLYCSPSNPCWGLKLQDIKLTYFKSSTTSALSFCTHAWGIHSGVVKPASCLSK